MRGLRPTTRHLAFGQVFRDFAFANPVRFYTSANPDFFRGTAIEAEAARIAAERA